MIVFYVFYIVIISTLVRYKIINFHHFFSVSFEFQYIPNFLMTSGSGLTPTLTPTTLATIEQTFMDAGHSSGRDPATQSGFVPPVVDHSADVSQESGDGYSSCSEDWEPRAKSSKMMDVKDVNLIVTANGTINATPQRKYTRRNKDEKVSPTFYIIIKK